MILKFNPVLHNKIWGGNKLKTIYNYPASDNCGEVWGISAHPNGSSIVSNTNYKGMTLIELFDNHKELFGNYKGNEFPILVKVIDAKDNLSMHNQNLFHDSAEHGTLETKKTKRQSTNNKADYGGGGRLQDDFGGDVFDVDPKDLEDDSNTDRNESGSVLVQNSSTLINTKKQR